MKGERKEFSQSLYNEHDSKARNKAIEYWSKKGYVVTNNSDKYGIDLILLEPKGFNIEKYLEVEIKNTWDTPVFKFKTLQIPERKGVYVKMYGQKATFMVLSKDISQAFIVYGDKFTGVELKEVKNKYKSSGELFYQIPLEKCELIRL